MINIFEMLGAGFFLVMLLMLALFVVYYFKRNASIVDIGWSLCFVLAVWAYFFLGQGYAPKRWIIALMVTIWGGRLAWQLYLRYIGSEEDPRYQELRRSWGDEGENFKFFVMFIFQGVLALLLSVPFLIICGGADAEWHGVEALGILFWLVGVVGEAAADQQLYQFKQNPANQGKVCQTGLWSLSRHPNYFFEFIIWVGYFLFALGSPMGWLAILSPALMLILLTKVSGIPLAEAQALKSKGIAYQEYQKTTSPFIPWPSGKSYFSS